MLRPRDRAGGAEAARACETPYAEPAVSRIDVLVVDRMGKNISGVGIDPTSPGESASLVSTMTRRRR
jgi:hypothetical protein